jgi:UDP-N-acetylmuramate dehydrogenase
MNAGTREGSISQVLSWVDLLDERGNPDRIHRWQLSAGYRSMGLPPDRIVTGACLELQRSPVDRIKTRLREIMGQRRKTQPLGWPSAGCVFKNPGNAAAGALIDAAGLKGVRWGGAEVSEKHANWIINRGNATREDILGLIQHIEKTVWERLGVRLEREIRVWGE